MSDDSNNSSKTTDNIRAIGEVLDKVPVYQDAIQPAAKELGKGLKIVAQAVNAALVPVESLIWGVDQIREFVRERVAKKLENVPPEDIQQPKPHVAVPVIDALRYTGSESNLAELYANLLATSMDKQTAYRAHPAFVDMIKNMCPDEAKIMKYLSSDPVYPLINIKLVSKKNQSYFISQRYVSLLGIDSGCEHTQLIPNYIDNLERLGLIQVELNSKISDDQVYKRIEDYPQIKKMVLDLQNVKGRKVEMQQIGIFVTDLGKQFIRSCVVDKNLQARS